MGFVAICASTREEEIVSLRRRAEEIIDCSIADSTKRNYSMGLANYLDFCKLFDVVPFPLQQTNMILFATKLSTSESVSSINTQLSAIKFASHKYGYNQNFAEFRRLYLLLRGLKRIQGKKSKKKKRLPITPSMLLQMKDRLFNSSRRYNDKVMIWSAMMSAFFGFMRVSEYTSPRATEYLPNGTLCLEDVWKNDRGDGFVLCLKASKTDPFREGVQIKLMENNSELCPVVALKQYLNVQRRNMGPLYVFESGSYLTRQSLSKVLKSLWGKNEGLLSTHSFRIGAATTAAASGLPDSLIKGLGRWSSDCFRGYIRISDKVIKDVSGSLIQEPRSGVVFDPDARC